MVAAPVKKGDPVAVYHLLLSHYGSPGGWWPAEHPFEVMVGSILTQNTRWQGVERAMDNLRMAGRLSIEGITTLDPAALGELIRPSGYYNLKAKRLLHFVGWYRQQRPGCWQWETKRLRQQLLQISGVGPETADDMLLYAFKRAIFVVDAYTRRISSGVAPGERAV